MTYSRISASVKLCNMLNTQVNLPNGEIAHNLSQTVEIQAASGKAVGLQLSTTFSVISHDIIKMLLSLKD